MKQIKTEEPMTKVTDCMKEAGKRWRTLEEEEKSQYKKAAQKDAQRYENQKRQMEQEGFFIMDDGQKSTCTFARPNKRIKRGFKSMATQTPIEIFSSDIIERSKSAFDEAMKKGFKTPKKRSRSPLKRQIDLTESESTL